jgi:Tfp pilus assembly PilM family ATPase
MLKGYLAIEFTASKMRYLYLNREGRGYKVLKSGVLSYSFNALVTGDLLHVLQELIRKEEIIPQRLFVTLCLQENYIRQVKLPKMSARILKKAVTAQIEENHFFNGRKFDCIYQVSKYADEKSHVVFAAVEQTILDYLFRECRKLGIPFTHLEIAPLNLNGIVYLIEPNDENQAVIVVHDQVSYLMIYWGRQVRLIHQSTIGIEQLYPHHNDKISNQVLTRFIGDLKQALNSYQSRHRLERLEKVWLLWDRQGAAGFDLAMNGQLGLDVKALSLERMDKFTIDSEANEANPIFVLCATPAIIYFEKIKEKFSLNHFVPAGNIAKYVFDLLIVTVLVLEFAGYFLGIRIFENFQKQKFIKMDISVTQEAIKELNDTAQELDRELDELLIVRQILSVHAKYISSLNTMAWSQGLAVYLQDMPKNMSLTTFNSDESGQLSFIGESSQAESVSGLNQRMEKSPWLQQSRINLFSEKLVDDQKVYSYGIKAQLKTLHDMGKSENNE